MWQFRLVSYLSANTCMTNMSCLPTCLLSVASGVRWRSHDGWVNRRFTSWYSRHGTCKNRRLLLLLILWPLQPTGPTHVTHGATAKVLGLHLRHHGWRPCHGRKSCSRHGSRMHCIHLLAYLGWLQPRWRRGSRGSRGSTWTLGWWACKDMFQEVSRHALKNGLTAFQPFGPKIHWHLWPMWRYVVKDEVGSAASLYPRKPVVSPCSAFWARARLPQSVHWWNSLKAACPLLVLTLNITCSVKTFFSISTTHTVQWIMT